LRTKASRKGKLSTRGFGDKDLTLCASYPKVRRRRTIRTLPHAGKKKENTRMGGKIREDTWLYKITLRAPVPRGGCPT